MEVINDSISGKILKGRYRVDRFLDNGSSGRIFTATDIAAPKDTKPKVPLVIKIQKYDKFFKQELEAMLKVQIESPNQKELIGGVPQVIDHGYFDFV